MSSVTHVCEQASSGTIIFITKPLKGYYLYMNENFQEFSLMFNLTVKLFNPDSAFFNFSDGKLKITELFYSKNKELAIKAMMAGGQLQEKVNSSAVQLPDPIPTQPGDLHQANRAKIEGVVPITGLIHFNRQFRN